MMSRRKIPRKISKLRAYLAEHRIRQLDIARKYGCTKGYIGMVLREEKRTTPETLGKVLRAIEAVKREQMEGAA